MAETVTIARPYAEAVFQLAREQGALAQWSDRLESLANVAGNTEVAAVIDDPNVRQEQLVELFSAACGKADDGLTNLLMLLAKNDRLTCLPEIAGLYETYKRAEEGTRDGEILSAFPLSDAQVRDVTPELEKHFKCKLNLSVKVDEALIGGVVVTVGDQTLDASVRGKLAAMAVALKN
ncbi:MAG: F-type H+-transporting ATPase subunit delta [Pseudomonadota bacterium]|jgi:F-type H+-transporting ATPase subunit delta|nr:F-type H+-transporting ATPase subunit delta [Pseudomonadota bacterium]MDQ5903300.1 F-type H+-transporting ATPase subunit delta [Pseudomonadota bacterium]MDQ5907787.1 F-type H+-transporting ATPase subunit delta [Pseudomonadota bacterium]MDQ5914709.1 F-type H+-transporting ATPase subunit delta [Pseudomonadota bacterium]MDQ5918603.1 F-type H+-transporting ATPase subunit delta [Pseudomonadota bacterium]